MEQLATTTEPTVLGVAEGTEARRARNLAAKALLHRWMADESGYEEENAEAIERALRGAPLHLRDHGAK